MAVSRTFGPSAPTVPDPALDGLKGARVSLTARDRKDGASIGRIAYRNPGVDARKRTSIGGFVANYGRYDRLSLATLYFQQSS